MKIKEVEALCAKVVEQVSQSWEDLINDEELEQVTKKLHTVEEKFKKLKNDIDKLPMTENMSKDVDLKKLQQQVARLNASAEMD